MTSDAAKRKLAAIMFTDMVGYTALMERDEPKARETIERHREIMKPYSNSGKMPTRKSQNVEIPSSD